MERGGGDRKITGLNIQKIRKFSVVLDTIQNLCHSVSIMKVIPAQRD